MKPVAALFVRADSIYFTLPGVDCWTIERDARNWPGGCPGVFHPPCRAWGRLSHMANPRPDEKDLARWAVDQARRWGGVLEHPIGSRLWADKGLPEPGQRDDWGGWTLPVHQHWWGHRAEKATRLYVVGCPAADAPRMPLVLGNATHVIGSSGRRRDGTRAHRPMTTHAEREHTPEAMAAWLVELARRCTVAEQIAA